MPPGLPHLAFMVLLAVVVLAPSARAQGRAADAGGDFPSDDYPVWLFVQQGLKNEAAARALVEASDSPETLALLLEVDRVGDALAVLRHIVDRRPEQMGAAFKVATNQVHRFSDDGRGHPSMLREIVMKARERLRELPREQAADAALHLRLLASAVPGERRVPWRHELRAFLVEYPGTQAALRAELQLLEGSGDLLRNIAAFETFARAHPGTAIGAQALYLAAFHMATNVPVTGVEPSGADPTERFLRVVSYVRELQSGAYPDCEWVRQAPGLVIGVFASEPRYARENVPRLLTAFSEFLSRNFAVVPSNPLQDGVGYFITSKLQPIAAAGDGDPVARLERVLLDLETAVEEPAAVRYVRGLWYRQMAEQTNDAAKRDEWRRRADLILLDLARAGAGAYNRRALATLASMRFRDKDCRSAVERYGEFLSRFPRSDWAWVARLRQGQCEQFVGHWSAARQAYESATSVSGAPPPARVLGHAFAGRASEALDDFQGARTSYERAERAWEPHFADPHQRTYQFRTWLDDGTCVACDPRQSDVSQPWLRRRVAQLRVSASLPGGTLLERGRSLVAEGAWPKAVAALDEFIRLHPESAGIGEAHELRTRARLEIELLRAGPDSSDDQKRVVMAALDQLAAEPYGFSVFAVLVTRATLHSMLDVTGRAGTLMSDALARWHEHGAVRFAGRASTRLERDALDIRDVVFQPKATSPEHPFRHLATSGSPPTYFVVTPEVRLILHDNSDVRVEAASRLATRPGALVLDEDQIAVLVRILMALGGTKRRAPQAIMEVPNQPVGDVEHIQRFWNRFFPMGPGHWGGWILETFPIVLDVTFIDATRTKAAARIRVGYSGSTQLLTRGNDGWKVSGSTGHWIE